MKIMSEKVEGISFEDMLSDLKKLDGILRRLNYATLQGIRWERDKGNQAAQTHIQTLRQFKVAAYEEMEMELTVFNSKVETYEIRLVWNESNQKWSLDFYD